LLEAQFLLTRFIGFDRLSQERLYNTLSVPGVVIPNFRNLVHVEHWQSKAGENLVAGLLTLVNDRL
jgi:hypothetical protein